MIKVVHTFEFVARLLGLSARLCSAADQVVEDQWRKMPSALPPLASSRPQSSQEDDVP